MKVAASILVLALAIVGIVISLRSVKPEIPTASTPLSPMPSLLIEDMTWTEVRDAIAAGKTTAIYYAGSIEQNGPSIALGKHVFIARYLAQEIAVQLGDALVYPTMPFAPTGDWGTANGRVDPAKQTGHMRMAGSVNVSEATFGAVARDVALSAIAAGFKNVVLMEDHGGGQETLGRVAAALNKEFSKSGIHVYYIPDSYYKEKDFSADYLTQRNIPIDMHAGTDDTSEVLYVDQQVNNASPKWIRPALLINAEADDPSGVIGDQTKGTIGMGKVFTDEKIRLAVAQIKDLIAAGK